MIEIPDARIIAADTRFAEAAQRLRNDPDTAFLLVNRATPSSVARVEDWIRSYEPPRHLFFVVSPAEDEFFGYLTVTVTDPTSRVAELGIALADNSRGRGIGANAIGAIAGYCEDTLSMHKLMANVLVTNEPSLRLFKGRGFEQVGVMHQHFFARNQYWDVAILERILS